MDLTVNSALQMSWHDETGRILTVRCGHVDVAHPNGYFALYINNAMAYITDKEPNIGPSGYMMLANIIEWGEDLCHFLYREWESLPDEIK